MHGRTRYQHGCRCEFCKAANAEYSRRRREARQRENLEIKQQVGGEPDYYQEILEVTCWCEEHIVRVDRELVHQGMTNPCRRRACKAIARANGWRPPVEKGQERAKAARSVRSSLGM